MIPRAIIDKERRRYEDEPGYTLFRWGVGAIKIITYALLGWMALGMKDFLMDYRKDRNEAKETRAEVLQGKIDNIRQDITLENHGVRINKLEGQ